MKKLLKLTVNGIKNIENEVSIEFANSTIENGFKKVNNIKGIYGYNGSGKTALITAIYLYKNISLDQNYLLKNNIINDLNNLINKKINEFSITMIFEYDKTSAIKHEMKIGKDKTTDSFIVLEEIIGISLGRTINENYKIIYCKTNNNLDYKNKSSSIVPYIVNELKNRQNSISELETIIFRLYLTICQIEVDLSNVDKDNNHKSDILKTLEQIKETNFYLDDLYLDDFYLNKELIDIDKLSIYQKENEILKKFLQVFKPELWDIELDIKLDNDKYYIQRIFVYEDYKVNMEFESSGIKQLISIFKYLYLCSKGKIVFIDEIDANIHGVYFKKLMEFFKNYGKGQLIFTAHDLEAMDAIKSQSKSIVSIGTNNKLYTWVSIGNKSPIKDYENGFFINSPMNVEDYDFLNVFYSEDN